MVTAAGALKAGNLDEALALATDAAGFAGSLQSSRYIRYLADFQRSLGGSALRTRRYAPSRSCWAGHILRWLCPVPPSDPSGTEPAYDAVAECWFESPEAMQAVLASPEGQAVYGDIPNLAVTDRLAVLVAVGGDERGVRNAAHLAGDQRPLAPLRSAVRCPEGLKNLRSVPPSVNRVWPTSPCSR